MQNFTRQQIRYAKQKASCKKLVETLEIQTKYTYARKQVSLLGDNADHMFQETDEDRAMSDKLQQLLQQKEELIRLRDERIKRAAEKKLRLEQMRARLSAFEQSQRDAADMDIFSEDHIAFETETTRSFRPGKDGNAFIDARHIPPPPPGNPPSAATQKPTVQIPPAPAAVKVPPAPAAVQISPTPSSQTQPAAAKTTPAAPAPQKTPPAPIVDDEIQPVTPISQPQHHVQHVPAAAAHHPAHFAPAVSQSMHYMPGTGHYVVYPGFHMPGNRPGSRVDGPMSSDDKNKVLRLLNKTHREQTHLDDVTIAAMDLNGLAIATSREHVHAHHAAHPNAYRQPAAQTPQHSQQQPTYAHPARSGSATPPGSYPPTVMNASQPGPNMQPAFTFLPKGTTYSPPNPPYVPASPSGAKQATGQSPGSTKAPKSPRVTLPATWSAGLLSLFGGKKAAKVTAKKNELVRCVDYAVLCVFFNAFLGAFPPVFTNFL
jgi:hypothetical protein